VLKIPSGGTKLLPFQHKDKPTSMLIPSVNVEILGTLMVILTHLWSVRGRQILHSISQTSTYTSWSGKCSD